MTKRRRRKSAAHCPCASGNLYARCCGPYHTGDSWPATPQDTVRSRYAAYARGAVDYIVDTTCPDGQAWKTPVDAWRKDIASFGRTMDFLGVDILAADVHDETATVTFHARLRHGDRDASFTEESRFIRRDHRWLYLDGTPE